MPGLLAFHLQREHVVQIEVRLERLHSLEGAVDVRSDTRGELTFEHMSNGGDFRTDAVDVIGDEAGTHAEQRLDLGRVGRRLRARPQIGRVAIVLAQRCTAPEINLQRVLVPIRRDPEQFIEALPAERGRTARSFAANVQRALAEVLRAKGRRVEWCYEGRKIHGAVTLAPALSACRETAALVPSDS